MKHKILYLILLSLIILLFANLAMADEACYFYGPGNSLFFASPFEDFWTQKETVIKNIVSITISEESKPAEILITKNGFEPKDISVKVNQPIVWKNQQYLTRSLVYGVREISEMKSSYLKPRDDFSWKFSQPGVYTYVDAVVLGRVGRIVVQ